VDMFDVDMFDVDMFDVDIVAGDEAQCKGVIRCRTILLSFVALPNREVATGAEGRFYNGVTRRCIRGSTTHLALWCWISHCSAGQVQGRQAKYGLQQPFHRRVVEFIGSGEHGEEPGKRDT
jgi:hypothetical protein